MQKLATEATTRIDSAKTFCTQLLGCLGEQNQDQHARPLRPSLTAVRTSAFVSRAHRAASLPAAKIRSQRSRRDVLTECFRQQLTRSSCEAPGWTRPRAPGNCLAISHQ